MSDPSPAACADAGRSLLELYDTALPQVYGYLLRRCGTKDVAEDLTSETFLAAVDAVRRDTNPSLTIGWLIGTARHKLADHWRREAREQRKLHAVVAADVGADVGVDDPWDVQLDAVRADDTLATLAPQHRLALTLRYLDDLPVPQVAELLGRTVHATEALLVRARRAFRDHYEGEGTRD